jgi:hypothetical protein
MVLAASLPISRYPDFIEQSVIFYDEHYRMRHRQRTGRELTEDGKLHIHPSNALEGHPNSTNPTSVIAGLRQVLAGSSVSHKTRVRKSVGRKCSPACRRCRPPL